MHPVKKGEITMGVRLRGISGPVPPRNQRGLSRPRHHRWPDRSASGPWRHSCGLSIRRRSGSWRGPRKPRQRTRCTMQVCTVVSGNAALIASGKPLKPSIARQSIAQQSLSIRIGQAGYLFHFRPSRSSAFAMTISLRMTAVMASFFCTSRLIPVAHIWPSDPG
jgi:hypothetical protein